MAEMLEDGFIDYKLAELRAYYKNQRDMMMAALKREFPEEAVFSQPAGGMFVWCQLPETVNATDLLQTAVAQNVAYMPGSAFFHDDSGHNTIRLSFTLATEAQMNEGIKILGEIFNKAIAE